jgi:long-chain acyl-CoA synthetase
MDKSLSSVLFLLSTRILLVVLTVLDFIFLVISFGWLSIITHRRNKDVVRSLPVGDEPSHRRMRAIPAVSAVWAIPAGTVYELSKRAFETYPNSKCMGVRRYVGQKSEKVKEFGDTIWKTYSDVETCANRFGAALRQVGIVPAPEEADLKQLTTPCSLAIFENTCPEWMIAAQGCFTQSVSVTTIYATLGIDAVIGVIRDCRIGAILCNKTNVEILLRRQAEIPTLKTIIYTTYMCSKEEIATKSAATDDVLAEQSAADDVLAEQSAAATDIVTTVTIMSFDDFVKSGDIVRFPPTPPRPSTCAVIMFTSGSTGSPKGVVVTHRNLCASIAGASSALHIRTDDVYLGYLPLAHILELMAELSMIAFGCVICYADPKTLTTAGAYPIGALEQYSPTIMAGVPKIWDIIRKGIQTKVANSSPLSQFVFETAFRARKAANENGYDSLLFRTLVFDKLSTAVGGRLRLALSGGGPLNPDVQEFIRTCFGCPLIQGYGLTETCAALTISSTEDTRTGIAGVPLSCCEVKLESSDITDSRRMPYRKTDTMDVDGNPIFGRGEICVRGPNVTLGYYMMPNETKLVYDDDGFFHTGDIGQFMTDGSLRIVDRKKNLVKLHGGEYIAIEHMEMVYGNSEFVDAISGGLLCYGDGEMDRPVCLMQLNRAAAEKWCADNHIRSDNLLECPELNAAVLADLHSKWQTGGLSPIEKIAAVTFVDEPFTPENGCLTAANKLDRRAVIEKFNRQFRTCKDCGIFSIV